MKKLLFNLILISLIIYIISPLDLMPHFIDDLFALGLLWYLWSKKKRQKKQWTQYSSNTQSQEGKREGHGGALDLEEAYRLLGVNQKTSWGVIQKAFKEKVVKSHPDKVTHLSEELQTKAKEITLQLNKAIEIIRRYKNI